jgi:hypothetical protein
MWFLVKHRKFTFTSTIVFKHSLSCYSLKARDYFPQPYKITGKCVEFPVIYIGAVTVYASLIREGIQARCSTREIWQILANEFNEFIIFVSFHTQAVFRSELNNYVLKRRQEYERSWAEWWWTSEPAVNKRVLSPIKLSGKGCRCSTCWHSFRSILRQTQCLIKHRRAVRCGYMQMWSAS